MSHRRICGSVNITKIWYQNILMSHRKQFFHWSYLGRAPPRFMSLREIDFEKRRKYFERAMQKYANAKADVARMIKMNKNV